MKRRCAPALLGAGVLLAALLGAAWLATRPAAAVAPRLLPWQAAAEPVSAVGVAPAKADRSAAQGVAPAPDAPGIWELCGIGRVPVPAGAAPDVLPEPLGALPLAELTERTLASLRQGTPREQGAAIVVAGTQRGVDPAGNAAEARQLALIGRDARDPVVMHWALARCGSDRACRADAAEAWARFDPQNLAPWLELLGAPASAERALAGARAATNFAIGYGVLADTVAAALPREAPRYVRAMLLAHVNGIEAALPLPSLLPLTARCPAHGAGRDDCSHYATVLTMHGDTLLGYAIGLRLAERAGWPAERLAALRADRERVNAGSAALTGQMLRDADAPWSCAAVERQAAFVTARGRHGELDAARRAAPR